METRKFYKDDAVELNEEEVLKIYKECLPDGNTEESRISTVSFSQNPNVPKVSFDLDKLKNNKEKVRFLFGQLYYLHHIDEKKVYLSISNGCVNYKGEAWTKNQTILFALYYLGVHTLTISSFFSDNTTDIFDYERTVPTISPNDPRFEEWSKEHIEQNPEVDRERRFSLLF